MHIYLPFMGTFAKDNYETVSRAAIVGGTTTLIEMICPAHGTATNIAANVVSPANDFSNLAPAKISFRLGGLITGIIGVLMMPWKLVSDPS